MSNHTRIDMWTEIIELIEKLVRARTPSVKHVSEALGVELEPARRGPSYSFYVGQLQVGPFREADFRLREDGAAALLNLTADLSAGIPEDREVLGLFGPQRTVDVVPEVPPEGIFIETFQFRGARVSLAFTTKTRRLHGVSIRWGADAQNRQT